MPFEGIRKYNERIIKAIKVMLAECKTADDYYDVLEFAWDYLEPFDENCNELDEPKQIIKEILQTLTKALQKS